MAKYVLRYKKLLALTICSIFGFVVIELGFPTIMMQILSEKGLQGGHYSYVLKMALLMFVISLFGLGLLILGCYAIAKITANVVYELRKDVFAKIQTFSHEDYENLSVSSLITTVINDPYQIKMFLQIALRTGLIAPVMFISSVIMMYIIGGNVVLPLLIAVPFLIFSVVIIAKKSKPLSEKQQLSIDDINLVLKENLSGIRVMRAFGKEEYGEGKFDKKNTYYASLSTKLFKLTALSGPIFGAIFFIVMAAVVWLSSKNIAIGMYGIEKMSVMIDYIFHVLFSAMMFATIITMYPRAKVSSDRVLRVLSTNSAIKSQENATSETTGAGVVEFENVSFAYSDAREESVLAGISFKVNAGETIAFIGSTGSGKSTVTRMIPRLYDVTAGKVLVEGVDVREYDLDVLRNKIGYVTQKAVLFSGSVKENILHGNKNISEKDVIFATDIAQAKDFIDSKENGLEEFLSEGGTNLSGGQKQRLSISRAVVRKPDIYIFDDSFSALDYKTDRTLRSRLKEVTGKSSVIIVAQRVSTIRDADRIYVLEDGMIAEQGSHDELISRKGMYYEIALSQFAEKNELSQK